MRLADPDRKWGGARLPRSVCHIRQVSVTAILVGFRLLGDLTPPIAISRVEIRYGVTGCLPGFGTACRRLVRDLDRQEVAQQLGDGLSRPIEAPRVPSHTAGPKGPTCVARARSARVLAREGARRFARSERGGASALAPRRYPAALPPAG